MEFELNQTGDEGDQNTRNQQRSESPPRSREVVHELVRCSLCGKSFNRHDVKTIPFCSTRCQQIDLGRWLDEAYGLPVESGPEDDLRAAE